MTTDFKITRADNCIWLEDTRRTKDNIWHLVPQQAKEISDKLKNILTLKELGFQKTASHTDYQTHRKHQVPLTPEERSEVMKRKAVWHHAPDGEPTAGIWKSQINGKTYYHCATHRAWAKKDTLKGAINSFPFIKSTS